jgi:dTMP kinase
MNGKFIVLEGLDGSGTTTQAVALVRHFFNRDKIHAPLLTREPTSLNTFGQEIRRRLENRLLDHERVIDDFSYWAHLFVSDRKWHLENVVLPNINLGLPVISDRHMLSTLAYQSAQGGQMEQLIKMHKGMQVPNLTIFLDVPASVALERIKKNREGSPEYFEKKEGFLKQTEDNYKKAIELMKEEHNVVIINGTKSVDEVSTEIIKAIDKLYKH